ncbi:MAG: regulatory protein RecX [Saprospiraceae bacterium]
MSKIYSSKDIFLEKLKKYCTYQERCQQEVINKMRELKIDYDWQDEIIVSLILEKYIDEERFARAIVRGKFRQNHWGRIKIKNYLFLKGIGNNLIQMSLSEINEVDYRKQIQILILKKKNELGNKPNLQNRLVNYLVQKGYESNLVYEEVNNEESI